MGLKRAKVHDQRHPPLRERCRHSIEGPHKCSICHELCTGRPQETSRQRPTRAEAATNTRKAAVRGSRPHHDLPPACGGSPKRQGRRLPTPFGNPCTGAVRRWARTACTGAGKARDRAHYSPLKRCGGVRRRRARGGAEHTGTGIATTHDIWEILGWAAVEQCVQRIFYLGEACSKCSSSR